MRTIQTKWTLLPNSCVELFSEMAISVEIEDEGAGPFISISQCIDNRHEVHIDLHDWSDVASVVGLAVKEAKRLEGTSKHK